MAFTPVAADNEGAKLGVAYLNVPADEGGEAQNVVLRVSRDGEPSVLAVPPQHDDERWYVTISGLTNPVPFTFRPWPEIAPDGSRFLFATADQSTLDPTYNLTIIRPPHDTVFSRSYPYPGEPIPDSAMDRGITDMVPESDLARRFRALARERAPLVYPPAAVTLGLDGTIWVELRRTDRGTPVHVLSETGDQVGSLLLPPRSRIRAGQHDPCVGDRIRPAGSRKRGSLPGDSAPWHGSPRRVGRMTTTSLSPRRQLHSR